MWKNDGISEGPQCAGGWGWEVLWEGFSLFVSLSLHCEIIQKWWSSQCHWKPVVSSQLLEAGRLQLQGLKPLGLCLLKSCYSRVVCSVLPLWAQLDTAKPLRVWACTVQNLHASSWLEFIASGMKMPSLSQGFRKTAMRIPVLKSPELAIFA